VPERDLEGARSISGTWATNSGIPLKSLYTSADVPTEYADALESGPGHPPFLRGAYPEMYRSKLWRIFQLSGFGDPQDMNARLKFLLAAGETGIIVKHDRMTDDHLYDVDHPEINDRREDVGLTGTVTVGLRDYETILDGIPIESIYAKPGGGVPQSAPYTQSCYWSVAERRGIPLSSLTGTGQSDFFLTYVGCPTKEQIPPEAALRFNLDIIEWCTTRMPHWVPVSIAGYNGADSGLTAFEELGAVFANAIEYLDGTIARGRLDAREFAHRIGGVNLRTSMDLFEDVAKLRVARKIWHDLLSHRYGVTDPNALRLRIHVVTAGSAMTYQEPLNNIVRGTIMALAAALGGTQSLGVSGYDEAMSIPSDHAHLMSIRIQQILQEETNLPAVADPMGGSYFLESLCAELEGKTLGFMEAIEKRGGFLAVIDDGWLLSLAAQHQADTAYEIEAGDRRVVGVNSHVVSGPSFDVQGFEGRSGSVTWERAMERLTNLRRSRNAQHARKAIDDLEAACRSDKNIVPAVMAAVQADASIGEIGDIFRKVFGNWEPPISF
jgi:methylmalonyl-CoA mutase, N-terminal domain